MKQRQSKGEMTCEMAQRAIALNAMASLEEVNFPSSPSASDDAFRSIPPADREHGHERDWDSSQALEADFATSADSLAEDSYRNLLPHFLEHDLQPYPFESPASEPDALTGVPGNSPHAASSKTQEQQQASFTGNDALQAHLSTCRACQAEMTATNAFFRALSQDAGPEPSATLLARSRMRLDATLDSCEQAPFWTRITQQFAFTAGRLRAAPVLSSGLLALGLVAGAYGGYHAGHAAHTAEENALLLAPPAPEAPSVVADVSSIRRDPDSGLVSVRYDRLVPDMLTAPADDPSIRELLMIGTENGTDPQVRDASVGLLAGACRGDAPCSGPPVRNALLNALANDKTPEVRREALAGLQPFISDDMQVRDAVLDALMNDPSATVRIEAVRLLQPVDVDSSVRQALHTVANSDGDPSIRSASLAALKDVPQVQ